MPDFQFTPILTVRTNDAGVLVELDWDWSDSGQGQWNEVTMEHDPTAAHESVCENLDKLPKRWVPEGADGPASIIGAQVHEPITPAIELLDTIEKLAAVKQKAADEVARAHNPGLPNVSGHDRDAWMLRHIAAKVRALVIPRIPVLGEPVENSAEPDARWRCDVGFPWILDEDNLPRYECGYGPTPEAAKAEAERIGRLVAEDTTGKL